MIEPDQAALESEPTPATPEVDGPSKPAFPGTATEVAALPDHLQVLLASLQAKVAESSHDMDSSVVDRAFLFANEHHKGQKRKSGEDYIVHPVEVAILVIDLLLDTDSVIASLLHDVVEDTTVSTAEVEVLFGPGVAHLVEGVTKLSKINFANREQAQIETYRKMIVAMAHDYRVILIKLADRLHNMRTIRYLPKQKQLSKAKETVEIYAPIAHRLGVHSVKWELEDLSFAVLYPRKYADIQQMVQTRKSDRDRLMRQSHDELVTALQEVGIEADISGRTKHFYSIFQKMQSKGKEFNEIYDLTGIRVVVDRLSDCYGAIGIIHSIWTPLPGRFKDYIAIPKMNGYQSLHTTVIGPSGKPLEIQVRTTEMHRTAEFGIAAHVLYKESGKPGRKARAAAQQKAEDWIKNLMEWESQATGSQDFMDGLRFDLYDDEVYVFTPKGQVKSLAAGATPLDFAYAVHTDVGHRCVGAKVNGRIVPLSYTLKSGDTVDVLTSNQLDKGPSRDWVNVVQTNRARSKIRAFFAKERREDSEQKGRDSLVEALKRQSIPHAKIAQSSLLAGVIREVGFKKAEEFYVAIGSGKFAVSIVVEKILQQLKTDEAVPDDAPLPGLGMAPIRRRNIRSGDDFGVRVEGIEDASGVAVRMAKCCMPVPGDPIKGYISLGRGITIHRGDCPNVRALERTPERFTPVHWEGQPDAAFRAEIQIEAWDRVRLLEEISRTISEHGCNIVQHQGIVDDQMVKERFTVELGDVTVLKALLSALRNVESIFDAYRVTPGSN
ncbi:MAG: bifunctional (p)ppGpp synthetase/guanosine-3,5-bis(diphosphate) 3-pyrophosphohydrolase [Thermoleophilia bacterium]|nr:bifunctional (p)ppGpp synthetase/guanosine-3,5-bis(diphosphate) 3-pyrophosphohydrolase [Thermoleophilia bacterium]